MIERTFSCPNCLVEFTIRIEPSYDEITIIREYPTSIEWLTKDHECPVCGSELDELD